MFSLIAEVVGGVLGIGKDLVKNKREEKKAVHSAKMKKIEVDDNWDIAQVSASKGSWKDEFWTIVLAIPLIMCFIPSFSGYVAEGFAVLETTPDWYRYAVLTAIAASFGVRQLLKLKG